MLEKCNVVQNRKYAGTAYGAVRLCGVGTMSLRGRARFPGAPKTAEIMRKGGDWFLSVTFNVEDASLAQKSGKLERQYGKLAIMVNLNLMQPKS